MYDRGSVTDGKTFFDFYYYVRPSSHPIVTTEVRRGDETDDNPLTVHGITQLDTNHVKLCYHGFNGAQRYRYMYIHICGF